MYIHDHRTFKMHGENGRKLLWLYVPPQEKAVISSYVRPELTLKKKDIIIIIIIILSSSSSSPIPVAALSKA